MKNGENRGQGVGSVGHRVVERSPHGDDRLGDAARLTG